MKKYFVLILLLSCAHYPTGPHPDALKVTTSDSAPSNPWIKKEKVWGNDGSGCGARGIKGNYEAALLAVKNHAAFLGANYVHILHVEKPHFVLGCLTNRYRIVGDAYFLTTSKEL